MLIDLPLKSKFLINTAFYIVAAALMYCAIRFGLPLFIPFIIGFLVAYMLRKPVRYLKTKNKFLKNFAAPILVIGALFVFFILVYGIFAMLINELKRFYSVLPVIVDILPGMISDFIDKLFLSVERINPDIANFFIESINTSASKFIGSAGDFLLSLIPKAGGFIAGLPNALIFVVATVGACFLCTSYFDLTKESLRRFIPKKIVDGFALHFSKIIVSIGKMIKGYSIILIISFFEVFIILTLMQMPYAFTLSLIICFIDILPIVGISTIAVPWAIIAFASGDVKSGVYMLILYIINIATHQILEPKVIGKQIGLNPLLTLISIYVGLKLFGVIGMLVLPLCLIILKNLIKNGDIKLKMNKNLN